MEIDKKELKKISRKFRSLGSRVINAYFAEQTSLVKMLIDYINNTPIIKDYIDSLYIEIPGIVDEIKEVANSYGRKILSTGTTPEEEVSYIYQLLSYYAENDKYDIYMIGWGYSNTQNYQDMAKCFGDRVVVPFLNEVDSYMMNIATDMGYDEEVKYMITINGGQAQVNVANDSGTVNTIQNNQINNEKVENIIKVLKDEIKSLPEGLEKDSITENIEFIESEIKKTDPNTGLIKMAGNTINTLATRLPQMIVIGQSIKSLFSIFGIGI